MITEFSTFEKAQMSLSKQNVVFILNPNILKTITKYIFGDWSKGFAGMDGQIFIGTESGGNAYSPASGYDYITKE